MFERLRGKHEQKWADQLGRAFVKEKTIAVARELEAEKAKTTER